MGTPAHWKQNITNPKCNKCGSESFTEIGECVACGEILVFFGNEIIPKKSLRPTRRKITAAEKWSKTRIPKEYKSRCIICGCKPPKIEDIYKDGFIPIMVTLLLKERPEWQKAKNIIKNVYSDCETREKEILLVTKALVREKNMVLPIKHTGELQRIAEQFLGEGEYSACLKCLATDESTSTPKEEEKSLAAIMKKQVVEEEKDMGPKFKTTEKPSNGWGENTIDYEDWDDDPDENEIEEDPDWDDDEWEDDWEETDHTESAPTATSAPVPVETPATQRPFTPEETAGFWGDDNDDDWEEDIAAVRGSNG